MKRRWADEEMRRIGGRSKDYFDKVGQIGQSAADWL
jgi:hypothetical protein